MADTSKAGLRQLMPSVFNGIATAIAAAAGLIGLLHQTGYLGNHPHIRAGVEARARLHPRLVDQDAPVAAADAPAAPTTVASNNTAVAPGESADLPHARNLSGAWRDMGKNCHVIKQIGHDLTVTSYFADGGGLWAVGSGTVKGRSITVRINSAKAASPEVDLILSDDGREMSGMIKGTKTGTHLARWRRIGPSCSCKCPALPLDRSAARPHSSETTPELSEQHAHQLGMLFGEEQFRARHHDNASDAGDIVLQPLR
jgi:hypothetical protein